jgi:hypothetical protein
MGPLGNMLGIPKTKTVSQKTLSWFFRWEGCVGVPPMAPWATCWTQKARVPKAVAPSQGCSPSVSQASGNHWDCTCSSPLWLATLKKTLHKISGKSTGTLPTWGWDGQQTQNIRQDSLGISSATHVSPLASSYMGRSSGGPDQRRGHNR